MTDSSFFKMFGSVRLVQEVSRSSSSSHSTTSPSSSSFSHCPSDSSLSPSCSLPQDTQPTPFAPTETPLFSSHASSADMLPHVSVPSQFSTPSRYWIQSQPLRSAAASSFLTSTKRKLSRKNSTYAHRRHRSSFSSSSPITPYKPPALHAAPSPAKSAWRTPLVDEKSDIAQEETMNDDNGSQAAKSNKIKSQKLLCLWPLPIMTRYFIAISLFLSTLSTFGFLRFTCSSPSYVIYRHDIANLLLSPFIFSGSLHALLLFGWNVLILGLFEESLAHMLGGTRRFVQVLFCMFLAVAGLRQAIGYLFSKSTGWAVPSLFFSNALHECNQGIAPFLFSLLVVQSLSIDDKYILMYGNDDTNHKVTVRKVTLQLFMCMVNYAGKNILWWSLTGLLVGYMAMLAIQASLARDKKHQHDINDVSEFIKVEHYRRTPLWRLLWTAVKQGTALVLVTLPLLFICNQYYTREVLVDPAVLNQITHDRYLFSFVIMTAPRRGNPAFLSRTLESYLTNWPVNPEPGSLYDRMQMLVYTHFTNHTQYDVARHNYADDSRGRHYLKWIREDGNLLNQRAHVSKALSLAADQYQSTYIALVEDDFPVCGSREWRHIESVIYAANQQVPGHCGVFVGTGGSGLFMKPKIAKLASGLLLKYNDMPPDIILQKCLMGDLPECGECSQTLVTSKTLLMYHIGFNTSTSQDRSYKKDEFQCGWRHPFNGDPQVITL